VTTLSPRRRSRPLCWPRWPADGRRTMPWRPRRRCGLSAAAVRHRRRHLRAVETAVVAHLVSPSTQRCLASLLLLSGTMSADKSITSLFA